MTDEKAQGIEQIKVLILQDKLKEAYDLCNKLLLNFPESYRLSKLQGKIEKLVYKQNLHQVKEDMKELKPLWKEEKYDEILKKLTELQKFVPGYVGVEKQIQKAQKLQLKNKQHMQKDVLTKYMTTAEDHMKKSSYSAAITTLKRVVMKLPDYEPAIKMLVEARKLYIKQQIKDNEFLLNGKEFDKIEEFIKHLKTINPESKDIKALVKKLSKSEDMAQKFEKMDFTYKSFEEIQTLYQKKKYESAIRALKEYVKVDKDNFKALELLDKARKKFDKILSKEVFAKMKELQKKFRKQKHEMPKEFIRL
jgi:tetratricopeptide (TPR) repeat protein